ncbi:MAG: hypothetical protein IJI07_09915 [Flexilinea sp.]|nr:hypothetical protein [Flexilinea sp.]
MKKSSVYLIFALMMVMLLAVTVVAVRFRQEEKPFDIGDLSGADPEDALTAYRESGSAEDLVDLLKILCYRYKIEGDETVVPDIRTYGQELLDRAKAQTVDLEKMDQNGDILQILNVIRGTGAK